MLHLVTGGAGFLGSHLVDALIARGDEVIVADNLVTGSISNLEDAARSGKLTFAFLDVAGDPEHVGGTIREAAGPRAISTIFHLASPASPEAYGAHPWETLRVNGLATMSLIELALSSGARFVFSSTSEIYGDPLVHPQPEDYFGNVDPIGERACYDEGKRFGEAAISVAARTRGLDARIVRFFNCYGPRMSAADGRLVPALAEACAKGAPFPIHGTGLQTRSMTYVSDAVELLLLVATTPQPSLQPINIGNDDERTILEIAQAFAEAAGVPFSARYLDPRPGDPQRRRPDLTRARALGWYPKTDLWEGFRLTRAWLLDHQPEYV